MKQFTLDSDVILTLFRELFKDTKNLNGIIELLLYELDSDQLNHIMAIKCMDTEYKGFHKGDIVRVPVVKYHIDKQFHFDVLHDLGLLPEKDYVYGIVYDDNTWGSDFSPFSANLRIKLVYHDENKEPILHDYQAKSISLKKVDSDIEYFKTNYNKLYREAYGKD